MGFRNYDHLASLWEYEGWLNSSTASFARSHYAAYMVRRVEGLRIISLNTDLCKSMISISSSTLTTFQGIGSVVVASVQRTIADALIGQTISATSI